MSADLFSRPTRACLPMILLALLLAGCASTEKKLSDLPPIQPHEEPPSRTGNPRNYEVFGRSYTVSGTSEGYREQGLASWYGSKFHGRRTSSGPPFDMYAVTAAHKSLPLPTYVRVTNLRNQRSLVVKVNDRGPFVGERIIDLSYAAAAKLGMVDDGVAPVEVEALPPYQYLPGFPYDNPLGTIANATIPADPGGVRRAPEPSTALRFAKQEQPDNEQLAANLRLTAYRYPSFSDAPSPLTSADLTATSLAPRPEPQLTAHQSTSRATPARTAVRPFSTRARPESSGQQLYLQVGAFGERANAEQLQHRLEFDLPYTIRVMSDATLHRVKIGPLGRNVDLGALNHQLTALGLQTIQVVLE